jgi:HK97 family phage portal protein
MNIIQKTINGLSKNFLGLGQSVMSIPWATPGRWGKKQQLEQFNRYVYTIVSAFALDFAKSDIDIQRRVGNKWQDMPDHELVELLNHPNPQQSGFQFRELHAVYMKLAGESFWYRANGSLTGKPKELYLLRPDLIDVEVSKDNIGSVKKYILQKPGGGRQEFEPEEIVHHKYPNPINPYRGMGVIEAAMTYLQTEEFASDWTKHSIYNSGRPSGIINLKGKMNKDQFEQLNNRFKQEYSGTKNAGKTLLIRGFDGIDWAKMGMDLEGIDLEKVKKVTREDIMFMFRTSNTIMGITDDVNRANSREMRGVWMENVIKPKLDRFVDQINHSLTKPIYGKDFKTTYTDPNPETIEDRLNEWEKGVDKWLTKNQIIRERNELLGTETPDLEGGDMIWQPISLRPMKKDPEPVEQPQQIQEPEQEEPEDNNNEEPEENKELLTQDVEVVEKHIKELTKHERGEIMRKTLFTEQEQWELPYREAVREVFREQKKLVESSIALSEQKSFFNFDDMVNKELWENNLMPIVFELLQKQSRHMFDFVDDDAVQGTLEITPNLEKRMRERISRWASSVDEETEEQISETLAEGTSAGESVSKLRKRIEEVFEDAIGFRSERIARTETIYLSNEASQEAMQQLPSVVGKEWLANPGACEFCEAVSGKVVGLNQDFFSINESVEGVDGGVRVLDYENVEHPPIHTNCRCTILPVNFSEQRELRIKELEKMLEQYEDMDKRTKEAKSLLEEMAKEKEEIARGKEEINDTLKKIEELVK